LRLFPGSFNEKGCSIKNTLFLFANSFAMATAGDEIAASHLVREKQTISILWGISEFKLILLK
jgi:hypothetical protein